MRQRRILAFSFFPAYVPPRNGGVERLFRIYSMLSERFDVTLISSGEVGAELQTIEHGTSFKEIRVPKGPDFLNAYQELQSSSGEGDLSGPAIGLSCKTHGLIHDVYLSQYAASDIIIHDSPFLVECDLFRGFDQKARVYNSYNCESDLYASFHSVKDRDRRIERLVLELEHDLCRHSDLITTCSEADRQRFEELFDPIAPIEIVPNGVVPARLEDAGNAKVKDRLVFIGSNHKPNVEAATFIAEELAPEYPQLEFHLIGSCFAPIRSKNLIAHGLVDTAIKNELLRSASAAINPIVSGGGSSLKVADIGVSGTPLISTALGVRGFDLENGKHYIALSKEQFLTTLARELADTKKLAKVARNARQHILGHFAWSGIAGRFADRLEELVQNERGSKPYLVLNDYDSLAGTGGGATRTSGLCRGLSEHRLVIFMSFADRGGGFRRVSDDGRILSLTVAKTKDHLAAQASEDQIHWVSTADILNYIFAPLNSRFAELFRCAASQSEQIVCEHPYMVGLPRMYELDFVYSSQNFELGLKTDVLRQHPRTGELLESVREAEEYSCAASSLIVAVSQEDARKLSGTYRFIAPIIVIRNGSDAPEDLSSIETSNDERPSAIFMGSSHGPNVSAVQWIVEKLAPSMPEVDFRLLGSVSDTITKEAANVTALGVVSAEEKSEQLLNSTVALNPMELGSGSNVKVADYLQHGLPVLTTAFGSRGYEDVSSKDLHTANLDDFVNELSNLLKSKVTDRKERLERALRYRDKLSMVEGGRMLHRAIQGHSGERRRALYVTYRYNDPPLGGGEYYVDRLVSALAKDGWLVDLVAPEAESINDVARFGASFAGGQFQPAPTGRERIRVAKFPIDAPQPEKGDLKRIWDVQSFYEECYFRALPNRPAEAALAWGWGDPQARNRWCFNRAAIYTPTPARLSLEGNALTRTWVQLLSDTGELIEEKELIGEFQLECELPAGFARISANHLENANLPDPRPLGILISRAEIGGEDLTFQANRDAWNSPNEVLHQFRAHANARRRARDERALAISELRNPSSSLLTYVDEAVREYDLLITHNAIFGSSTEALKKAEKAGVPSILVPHLHLDDDFYHFSDVFEACERASRTLVCPTSTAQFLIAEGLTHVQTFTPGIDASEIFRPEDAEAFRQVLGRDDEFVLVLGRKAQAKGYADVIRSVGEIAVEQPLVVMIGPDDDSLPLPAGDVIYLGQQPRSIIRGALMECLALANMSRSESFGIVLLEAGLAQKPVLANKNCAAFADLVRDGSNGFLVTTDDLHHRLEELIAKPKLRKRMGAAGHKAALAYDWQEIERRFVATCLEVVEVHP